MKKDQFRALGRAQASAGPGLSAQRDWGSPEANRSADLMEGAQVSFIMKKKKKKNLIFHFPFLIEKYAAGVSLWFLVKGRIVVEPKFPWGLQLCVSLTLTLNACFQGCAGTGPPGLWLRTRQQACLLCLEGPVHAGRSQISPHLLPVPMTPPQPALQGEGKLGVDAQAGGRQMWAPGLGSKLVSGSARRLYRGLVAQKGGQAGSRQSVSGESVYPSCRARTCVPCSHAFCWCVSGFLVDLFLLSGKQIAP